METLLEMGVGVGEVALGLMGEEVVRLTDFLSGTGGGFFSGERAAESRSRHQQTEILY